MAETEKNMTKYKRYQSQFERLDLAMENKFYLEAIFIEYAILEDKVWSALKHAGCEKCSKTSGLDGKLNVLKELTKEDELAAKYFAPRLIGDVRNWKNDRNRFVHNLMEAELKANTLRGLAVRGKKLVGTFGSKVTSYNRALGRKKKVYSASN